MDPDLASLLATFVGGLTAAAGIAATFYRSYTGEWPRPRNGRAVHKRIERIEKKALETQLEVQAGFARLEAQIAFIRGWLEGKIGHAPHQES